MPFTLLLAGIFGSRQISMSAAKLLSNDQKPRLVDLNSENRSQKLIFPIALIVLYFIAAEFLTLPIFGSDFLFIAVILTLGLYSIYMNNKMLKKSEFPIEYIKKVQLATIVRYLAISMVFTMWH